MARTERRLSIPEWFDLDKYRAFGSLSMVDWALNLCVRSSLELSIKHRTQSALGSAINSKGPPQAIPDWALDLLSIIRQRPALTREDVPDFYEEALDLAMHRAPIDEGAGSGVVYSLPLDYAYAIYEEVHRDTLLRRNIAAVEYHRIFRNQDVEPLHRGEKYLRDWYDNIFPFTAAIDHFPDLDFLYDTPCACVNLDASDEVVMEAFRSWLTQARQCQITRPEDDLGHQRHLQRTTLDKWERIGVIPYIDLTLDATLNGKKLPLHVLGEAIRPDATGIDATEAVRKTTRKAAQVALKRADWFLRNAIISDARKQSGKI